MHFWLSVNLDALTRVNAYEAWRAVKLTTDQFIVIYWLGCVFGLLTDPICGLARCRVRVTPQCSVQRLFHGHFNWHYFIIKSLSWHEVLTDKRIFRFQRRRVKRNDTYPTLADCECWSGRSFPWKCEYLPWSWISVHGNTESDLITAYIMMWAVWYCLRQSVGKCFGCHWVISCIRLNYQPFY